MRKPQIPGKRTFLCLYPKTGNNFAHMYLSVILNFSHFFPFVNNYFLDFSDNLFYNVLIIVVLYILLLIQSTLSLLYQT